MRRYRPSHAVYRNRERHRSHANFPINQLNIAKNIICFQANPLNPVASNLLHYPTLLAEEEEKETEAI